MKKYDIMKKLIFFPLFLISIALNAQIEQYFLPSKEYSGKVFDFETKPIENDYHTSSVKYRRILSDTVDIVCSQIYYKNGIPYPMEDVYKTYVFDNKSVRHIYTYSTFFDEQTFRNSIILKYPQSTWVDTTKTDPDLDYSDLDYIYKSEFGKLTTKYGQYDCIILTITYKALNSSEGAKDMEKGKETFYYAKGLGLVKNELFLAGYLVDLSNIGTLVDHFSKNSFEVINEKK